jgi:hypothetical protein
MGVVEPIKQRGLAVPAYGASVPFGRAASSGARTRAAELMQ